MSIGKRSRVTVALLMTAVCAVLLFLSAPEHWMHRITWATVTVDNKPSSAEVYLGHPTNNEAEAIALVRIPGVANYFLDFENETYREAPSGGFLHLPNGVWTLKPMRAGQFATLLPFLKTNEFRISRPNGRVVSVQF